MELKDKLNTEIYLVEHGVLLSKDDREYECYSQVYDKKNGYYDEFIGCCIGISLLCDKSL